MISNEWTYDCNNLCNACMMSHERNTGIARRSSCMVKFSTIIDWLLIKNMNAKQEIAGSYMCQGPGFRVQPPPQPFQSRVAYVTLLALPPASISSPLLSSPFLSYNYPQTDLALCTNLLDRRLSIAGLD